MLIALVQEMEGSNKWFSIYLRKEALYIIYTYDRLKQFPLAKINFHLKAALFLYIFFGLTFFIL